MKDSPLVKYDNYVKRPDGSIDAILNNQKRRVIPTTCLVKYLRKTYFNKASGKESLKEYVSKEYIDGLVDSGIIIPICWIEFPPQKNKLGYIERYKGYGFSWSENDQTKTKLLITIRKNIIDLVDEELFYEYYKEEQKIKDEYLEYKRTQDEFFNFDIDY